MDHENETEKDRGSGASAIVKNVSIHTLHDFKNQPFKVENDTELFKLMKSIEREGVLVPLLARPNPSGEGLEVISGHRRKEASKWAGLTELPVVVKDLDDNQAVIALVDSNLQREHLKPSEKAFAYKMKLDAIKRQGRRTDLENDDLSTDSTSSQVVTKLIPENQNISDDNEVMKNSTDRRSDKMLEKQIGENRMTINRYIRLTNLIPKILDMVDEGKISLTPAVELSHLTEEEQYELFVVMETEECTPSLSQANRMKKLSKEKRLDMEKMYELLEEKKPNQKEQIKIKADSINKYFPKDFTPRQKVELIEKLVKSWHDQHIHKR